MWGYLARRLGWALLMIWGISLLTFIIAFALPGDPAQLIAGPQADSETVAAIRRELGLEDSLPVQYARYVGRLLRADLGKSYLTHQPVSEAIAQRLPATVTLGLTAWLIWLLGGISVGLVVAASRRPALDAGLLAGSIAAASMPTFWLGMLLLWLFADGLRLLPAGGTGGLEHLVLPALTLSVSGVAYYARLTHTGLLGTFREDYVRTARAKGVPQGKVVLRHALRNALLPLVTVAGADVAALMSGVVFTESVFGWQGMGLLAVNAVAERNVPLIMGVVLVAAALTVAANLAVDLMLPVLDPRIRAARSGATE